MNRFRETWGEFGWRQIHLRQELLWAIAIPTMLASVGLAVYVFLVWRNLPISRGDSVMRPAAWQRNTLIILFLTCVVAYLAVVQFGTEFALSQARYYFPASQRRRPVADAWVARHLLQGGPDLPRQGIVFGALVVLNIVILTGLRAALHGDCRPADRDAGPGVADVTVARAQPRGDAYVPAAEPA